MPLKAASWVAVIVVACLDQARAETVVYRCIGSSGKVAYADKPCPPRQRTDRIIESAEPATREPAPLHASPSNAPGTAAGARRSAKPSGRSSARNRTRHEATRGERCAAAKQQREAALRRVGIHKTFEMLHRLDGAVYDACK